MAGDSPCVDPGLCSKLPHCPTGRDTQDVCGMGTFAILGFKCAYPEPKVYLS